MEYIDRNLCETVAEYDQYYKLVVPLEKIRKMPSADVAPVVHGRWLNTEHLDGHMYGECSECHKIRIIDEYCSHCGARMDGGMK